MIQLPAAPWWVTPGVLETGSPAASIQQTTNSVDRLAIHQSWQRQGAQWAGGHMFTGLMILTMLEGPKYLVSWSQSGVGGLWRWATLSDQGCRLVPVSSFCPPDVGSALWSWGEQREQLATPDGAVACVPGWMGSPHPPPARETRGAGSHCGKEEVKKKKDNTTNFTKELNNATLGVSPRQLFSDTRHTGS